MKAVKRDGYSQLSEAKPQIQSQPGNGRTQRHDHKHNIAVSQQQQQGEADKWVEYRCAEGDNSLKYKLLVSADNGIKNTACQGNRNIDYHDDHQDPGFAQFPTGQF